MAEANLTLDRLKELLSYDPVTGSFFWLVYRRCGKHGWTHPTRPAGTKRKSGYLVIGIDGYSFLAHRLAWFYTHGVWPPVMLDHINRKPSDNRIENLRCVTSKQNQENQGLSKNNTTGAKGVYLLPNGRWNAKIKHNWKSINIGTFATLEEASQARKNFEKTIFTHSVFSPPAESLECRDQAGDTQ